MSHANLMECRLKCGPFPVDLSRHQSRFTHLHHLRRFILTLFLPRKYLPMRATQRLSLSIAQHGGCHDEE